MPPIQVGAVPWTAVGVIVALVSAVGGAAYTYGQGRQQSRGRGSEIEENSQQLEAMSYELHELRRAVTSLGDSFDLLRQEIQQNREDIREQHRLVHDQILGEGETCGNERCVFCHPENANLDLDLDQPFSDEDTFETFNSDGFSPPDDGDD